MTASARRLDLLLAEHLSLVGQLLLLLVHVAAGS